MLIRPATAEDAESIWRVLSPTIRTGETYALPVDMTREDALAYWWSPGHDVFVAEERDVILGTYYLRANQRGGGAHVANGAYMVSPAATGRGIAQRMCEHSLLLTERQRIASACDMRRTVGSAARARRGQRAFRVRNPNQHHAVM